MSTYGNDWIITFSNSKKHKCLLLCEQECEAGYDLKLPVILKWRVEVHFENTYFCYQEN